MILVAAGVLVNEHARILLAQRPPGKHLAGLWEFPGGKCEAGESMSRALVRELREELGIEAETGDLLISVPWNYSGKRIRLDALHVTQWRGVPESCEGQALRWSDPWLLSPDELAPADWPILERVRQMLS